MDHPAAPVEAAARKCDYLWLGTAADGKRLWVVPLELKGTGLNPPGSPRNCRLVRKWPSALSAAYRPLDSYP